MAKDMGFMAAIGADIHRHVFDYAQYGHIDLAEHVQALAGIQQGNVLWRGYNHGTGQRHLLRHRQLGIPGARRHINDQDVQFPPNDIIQHLLQRAHHHRAAPDDRLIFRDQKANRHDLDAIAFQGLQCFAIGRIGAAAGNAQHARLRRAKDVGVQHANPQAQLFQGQRDIDRRGGFPNTTLSAGDSDNMADLASAFLYAPRIGCRFCGRSRTSTLFCGQHSGCRQNIGHCTDNLFNIPAGWLITFSLGRVADFQGNLDHAVPDGDA